MKIIKLRRGLKDKMPLLHEAEIVYSKDTNEVFVGGASGNTTPNFDGGSLLDHTKGRLILRSGTTYEVSDIRPGELFYLNDLKSLAIGLENNKYIIFNQDSQIVPIQEPIQEFNTKEWLVCLFILEECYLEKV